jgi:rhodanese-related sulfurtransferase
MPTLSAILQTARERAATANLTYSGLLTPGEAYYLSQHAPSAHIVDVRSHAELELVGVVESAVSIEWQTFPGWRANPDFIAQLKASVDPESLVMFMCRTGGRSNNAAIAAQAAGYAEVFNIIEGFEGDKNAEGQRGYKNGWKVAGLPWKHK